MVRSKKKYILSENERENLAEEKNSIDNTIKAIESGTGEGTKAKSMIDVGRLKKESEYLDKTIREGSPSRISGTTKDKLVAEAKRLSDLIKEGMPTYDEMKDPVRNPGAIRKNILWEKRNIHNIQEWKQLQRQLEPDDPTISNVERLRNR